MFSMVALGLIDIPEVAGNDNIINTAKNGRLESGMADLIESQVYENDAYKPTWVKADGDKRVGGAAVVDGGISDSEYEDELFGTLE